VSVGVLRHIVSWNAESIGQKEVYSLLNWQDLESRLFLFYLCLDTALLQWSITLRATRSYSPPCCRKEIQSSTDRILSGRETSSKCLSAGYYCGHQLSTRVSKAMRIILGVHYSPSTFTW